MRVRASKPRPPPPSHNPQVTHDTPPASNVPHTIFFIKMIK
jgi:hypothetical protein